MQESVGSESGNKSWFSQAVKHNQGLLNQIGKLLMEAAKLKPAPGPTLARASNVPEDTAVYWDEMPLKHKLTLVEAITEYALGLFEVATTTQVPTKEGSNEDASRSWASQFMRHNPKLVKVARDAAIQAGLAWLGAGGKSIEFDNPLLQDQEGDTDRKPNWGRFRPPKISPMAVLVGGAIAAGFGVSPTLVSGLATTINAVRGVDAIQPDESSSVDTDRSWLSQAIKHNRKILNAIGQVVANAIINSVAEQVATNRSIEMMEQTGSSPADVVCWSGCLDNQTVSLRNGRG